MDGDIGVGLGGDKLECRQRWGSQPDLSHPQREWQGLGRGEGRGLAYERGVPEFWSGWGR